ncbi:MAG: hypothetical protein QGG36_20390 [Pirellulaceae bacterium]|jgi:hypothetical protein|nr:hypothetical protein [Pirellulaceae bacterium]MDP7018175.1 hypothetical protein [Pirellulaceae bacterium]
MSNRRAITIEGYSPEEILELPADSLNAFVFCGEPIVFRAGSAEILGQFQIQDGALILEFVQIDGGGEGVLPTISMIARQYARREGLNRIEWRVHAIDCANPNLKLRRVLERRGFEIRDVPGSGECYNLVATVDDDD